MESVLSLPIQQQRKVAAIVGACVADAAAQPLHWIYKDEVMHKLTDGVEEIEFWEPSANPYYRIDNGKNTCYGDQGYVVLKSLVESGGLNTDHLIQTTYETFGPDSDYENKETNQYAVGKESKTDIKPSLPIYAPWRHGCIKDFLKNLQEKKSPPGSLTDDQIDCAIRIIPVTALYAGHPDLLVKVEEALRVLQNCDLPVAVGLALARVLEQYILNGNPEDVLATVVSALSDHNRKNPQDLDATVSGHITKVIQARTTPHIEAVTKVFKNNYLPEAMQSALHGVITATSYVEGIRTTMLAGGCNASRSGFIGACLAAKEGFESIPERWRSKTLRYDEVLQLALKLVHIKV
ncbi:hypothetical protein BsWGS_10887 [Bradybaena similaris]